MIMSVDDGKEVEPDLLLSCFAAALSGRPILPFALKGLLENAGRGERDKATNEEVALGFLEVRSAFERSIIDQTGALHDTIEAERPDPSAPLSVRLDDLHSSLQALVKLPMVQKIYWRLVLQGKAEIVTAIGSSTANQIIASLATQRLAELSEPDLLQTYLAAAADNRKSLFERLPRRPHRPPPTKHSVRYRTAAVAAAAALRKWQGGKPAAARAWVAAHLNRAGLRHHRGALLTPKTIENWSSKQQFDAGLLTCMEAIADRAASEGLPMVRAAEAAIVCAIAFGKTMEKTP